MRRGSGCAGACLALWLGGLLGLAGCAGLGAWPEPGGGVRSSALEERPDPICYALGSAAALSPEDAQALLPDAVKVFRSERTPESRLRVLLLLLRAPPREFGDVWALEILQSTQFAPDQEPGMRDVEILLQGVFQERLRAAAALHRAEAGWEGEREVVEALRSSLEEARTESQAWKARLPVLERERDEAVGRLRPLEASLEEERRRAADLEGQLGQLKAIERILERREDPGAMEGTR